MKKFRVIIISDATGDLGERFITSILTQLPKENFEIKVENFVNTPQKLEAALRRIKPDSLIFHLTIFPELKKMIDLFSAENKMPSYDLTGGAMDFIVRSTGIKPSWNLKRIHEIDTEYISKQESIVFTIKHDDGLRPEDLNKAEIILVGVSRTSKTPTSIYLAAKGYKVANVPFVSILALPAALQDIKSNKIVAFTINPKTLFSIRKERSKSYRSKEGAYSFLDSISEEIRTAERFYAGMGWPVLDVTDRATEENAAMVLKLLGKK
ncbi:MAG: pyruvate, phosphate dikinase/phosphoenolpyruvate synthase regulator [bacterium]|nr:pyruvate, phosphate dikinase/phosphoenolpyruvate synthase regulator [bacterium]